MGRVVGSLLCVLLLAPAIASSQGYGRCLIGPSNPDSLRLTTRVGLLEQRTGLTQSFDQPDSNEIWVDKTRLRGVYLGLSCHGDVIDKVGLTVSGGLLLPGEMNGLQKEVVTGETNPFEVEAFSWGFVEGLVSYDLSWDMELLGGFRWDRFAAEFDIEAQGREDLTVNAYLPLLGLRLSNRFHGGNLVLRFIGRPAVPGDIKWNYRDLVVFAGASSQKFGHGYYTEFFAEYTRKISGKGFMGVFVKWNNLHAEPATGTYAWRFQGRFGDSQQTLTHDRRSWTVGGTFSIDCDLSSLSSL